MKEVLSKERCSSGPNKSSLYSDRVSICQYGVRIPAPGIAIANPQSETRCTRRRQGLAAPRPPSGTQGPSGIRLGTHRLRFPLHPATGVAEAALSSGPGERGQKRPRVRLSLTIRDVNHLPSRCLLPKRQRRRDALLLPYLAPPPRPLRHRPLRDGRRARGG